MMKQLRETKQKLKLLHQTNKQAALAVVKNELNEIAQSEREDEQENTGEQHATDEQDLDRSD